MGLKTGIIKYNILERGRELVGQKRNFNVKRVMELINSPYIQELVNSGDLVGYLGHGTRNEFGGRPPEVISKGNIVASVEPAIKTVSIKAYEDGTIEHEAEFLDTPLGKVAERWFKSKLGGFSSVFKGTTENPLDFLGFDYVRMPNYATNRGYVLDSVETEHEINRLTSRQKCEYYRGLMEEMQAVMDAVCESNIEKEKVLLNLSEANQEISRQLEDSISELKEKRLELAEVEKLEASKLMRLNTNRNDWISQAIMTMDSVKEQSAKQDKPENIELFGIKFN